VRGPTFLPNKALVGLNLTLAESAKSQNLKVKGPWSRSNSLVQFM